MGHFRAYFFYLAALDEDFAWGGDAAGLDV
jgi:hypothetical protein